MSFHIFHCKTRTFIICCCDYCCFRTRKKKLNFMCILRINNCGKKADVKQILHCHRNPKDLEDIPPRGRIVTSKNGWKGASGQDQRQWTIFPWNHQSCLLQNTLRKIIQWIKRRWCSTWIIMSLWLMTEKRTNARACGYCKIPEKNELKIREKELLSFHI